MKNLSKIFLSLVLLQISLFSFGQDVGGAKAKPFKPPVVETFLGIRQGHDTLYKEEATQLVALPLIVEDKKKNKYEIVTYQFAYNRKGFIENPETGNIKTIFNLVASRFDKTPLPKLWIENIQPTLQKDEYFYFFDILVKNKEGRTFYAPEIKITIK